MREIYKSGVTPQQKIIGVNSKFGNTGIQSQQGTTRILYDTLLPATGQKNFRFFEDSASRTFPLTNTGSEGNKLGVGDTMVIAQLLFSLVFQDTATGKWGNQVNLIATDLAQNLGFVNIQIANNQVIKRLALSEMATPFNKDTTNRPGTLDLETSIVIPPLLPFVVELQLPESIIPRLDTTTYVQCQIIGVGGIIAPRTTF
jgi:hypothetical protein